MKNVPMRNILPSIMYFASLLGVIVCLVCNGCQISQDSDSEGGREEVMIAEETVELLSQQIHLAPRDYSLYQQRADLYYQQGKVDSAMLDINEAINLNRNQPELYYLKGFFSMANHDTVEAFKAYETAIGLGSKNPEVYYQLGQLHFFKGKDLRALELYQKAATHDSLEAAYMFAQGFLHESRDRYNEAIQAYQSALAIDSTFFKAMSRLHEIYLNHFENESFAAQYRAQMLAFHPDHPLSHFYEGDYHVREILRTDSSLHPVSFERHINQAISHYTIAIRKDSLFSQAFYNRAYCYFLAEDYDSAIADFERAASTTPNYAEAYFMLGALYEGFEDKEKALQYYRLALAAKPSFEDAVEAVRELTKSNSD